MISICHLTVIAAPAPARRRVVALACGLLGLLGVLAGLALPAAASARGSSARTQLVRYDGWQARVPASWPVYRLGAGSRTCVRFDRHAVYLGVPGTRQRCATTAVGRTEAVLVTPRSVSGDASSAVPTAGDAVARVIGRVRVTATWDRAPGAVGSALGLHSASAVLAAGRAYTRQATASVRAAARSARSRHGLLAHADAARGADALGHSESPGAVYQGLGFDACSAPSTNAMSAWSSSPFRAIGVYIGGTNMACSQSNLTASWVSAESAAGWSLIPIYVGLQAPGNGCGCAAISASQATAQGAAAANAAVQEAQALGLGAGNPIYDDMENYTRSTSVSSTVLAFLEAWTTTLHAAGYQSGVYSSELSGIEDLVSEQGTGYTEPDDIWIANWNGQESTSDPVVPASDWADGQRLHQYRGGHTDDYGGASISIDSDYVDGATAAPGSETVAPTIAAAPSVAVRPQANGTIDVTPSWRGETGVARWVVSGGMSAGSLATVGTVTAARPTLTVDDADAAFSVQAIGSAGQVLGTSSTITTPDHVAVFGHSIFMAPNAEAAVPVACEGITACRVTATVSVGRRRIAWTHPERVPGGGGLVYFRVSQAEHRVIVRAGSRGIPVSVTVRSTSGPRATVAMTLLRFATSGAGPRRVASTSRSLRILGVTDFVSHAWSGGILVACDQSTPCTATPTVRIGRVAVATSHRQTIGAGELGYLSFSMTHAGHARLLRARGNQLGVSVSLNAPSSGLAVGFDAHAQLAIDAF